MASSATTGAVRIVTAQSGRSFRIWKISAWVTLACINGNIAEQKGRGKFRWITASLLTGPLSTVFLTFSSSHHPDRIEIIPRSDIDKYSSEGEKVTKPSLSILITPPELTKEDNTKKTDVKDTSLSKE